MLVLEGLTLNVYVLDEIPVTVVALEVAPSSAVYVSDHGCAPVKATDKVVLPPLQITGVPEIIEVGNGLTITS